MKKSYRHLTRDDRSQIYAHKSIFLSNNRIAKKLGVERRTIEQETKRNAGLRGYRFQAHTKAVELRRVASSAAWKLVPLLWEKIRELLRRE